MALPAVRIRLLYLFIATVVILGFIFFRDIWGPIPTTRAPFSCPEKTRVYPRDKEVPNVVHFVHFDHRALPFVSYVCLLAAFFNQEPDQIVIHTNQDIQVKFIVSATIIRTCLFS